MRRSRRTGRTGRRSLAADRPAGMCAACQRIAGQPDPSNQSDAESQRRSSASEKSLSDVHRSLPFSPNWDAIASGTSMMQPLYRFAIHVRCRPGAAITLNKTRGYGTLPTPAWRTVDPAAASKASSERYECSQTDGAPVAFSTCPTTPILVVGGLSTRPSRPPRRQGFRIFPRWLHQAWQKTRRSITGNSWQQNSAPRCLRKKR